MSRRRWIALALVCLACGLGVAVKRYRYEFWPKRFAAVEAGQLYRGGWQRPRPLRYILDRYHIRTVLNVACNPSELDGDGEGPIVREFGIGWHKILMPGTGIGTYAQLDESADVLADPAKRPVFLHCAAGTHRTNMALAAYRLKHCGWTLDLALAEMTRYGFNRQRDWVQAKHLQGYVRHLQNVESVEP